MSKYKKIEHILTLTTMKLSQINKVFWTTAIVLVATLLSIFGSFSTTFGPTAKASPLPLLNKFTFGFSNDVYPEYQNSTFGGASNARLLSGPWFQTTWDAYGDEHTTWLSKFNEPANADKTPYFYAYIAAGKAKSAYGLHDCNVASPDLCHQGANFIRNNNSAIVQGYTDFANKIKQIYGTTRPIMIHPDSDFYQYTENAQQNGPLTFSQMQNYMNQWTSAIKSVLPNSILVMDISPWNNDIAGLTSGLQNFDYAGMVGKRYPPNGVDNKTYAQIYQATGKKMILNDAHGVNGALMSYPYNWEDRTTVQNAWNEGVVAVLMPGNSGTNSQLTNTIASYTNNPIPSGQTTTSSTNVSSQNISSIANSSVNSSVISSNTTQNSTNSSVISSSNPTSSNNNFGRCFEVLATRQMGGNDWYNLELSLKNTAPTTLSNWELSFDLPFSQNVQSGWNNSISQSGRTVTVSVSGSNINSNQTASIGGLTIINAAGNSTILPSIFSLTPNICPVSSTTNSQSSQNVSSQQSGSITNSSLVSNNISSQVFSVVNSSQDSISSITNSSQGSSNQLECNSLPNYWNGKFVNNWESNFNLQSSGKFYDSNRSIVIKDSKNALETTFNNGSYGVNETNVPVGGTGFKSKTFNQGGVDEACFSYYQYLEDGFDFNKGGKLPGFYGGIGNTGGNVPTGSDGFSTRLMWRSNGRGQVYAYLPSSVDFGTQLGTGSWNFETGR